MVKGGCFLPLKTRKAPEIKGINKTLYIITPIGVDEIRSLSAVLNHHEVMYGINPKEMRFMRALRDAMRDFVAIPYNAQAR